MVGESLDAAGFAGVADELLASLLAGVVPELDGADEPELERLSVR